MDKPAQDTNALRPGEERTLFVLTAIRDHEVGRLYDRWPAYGGCPTGHLDYRDVLGHALKAGYLRWRRTNRPTRRVPEAQSHRTYPTFLGSYRNYLEVTPEGEGRIAELDRRVKRRRRYEPTGRRHGWAGRISGRLADLRAPSEEG